ncbi:hypothetical protein AAFF_G00251450 [Aldrovandia affinis]|uniref:PDZ domain-containing protein n=1 Tax=Aldrovandia affinis TaxID=143900 RepID=A0AAD7W380_9TELE|nr:hypothetical protein AAFF_G00251450 [Aldrovandia affinis]
MLDVLWWPGCSSTPDGFTQLLNLTQLFLNDAFLECLPPNFGKLSKLRILELRENHLKTLPKSLHKLAQLERLDLGSNEFSELPDVLEQVQHLRELWMDNNTLQRIPGSVGKLKHLTYLDLSKNRIETLDSNISGCEGLEDLLLSSNTLHQLPDSIGMLKKLTTLKVDENQLSSLPNAIGSLSLLEDFDCSCNELESLPPTIGYLHNLRTFAADENFLSDLPREIGSCRNVTVMSLRSNKLHCLPDEIGQMIKLRVLNLSDNRLKNLPFTFTKLKDLSALWLSDNQSKALIPLQSEAHPETKQRVLTNYMFPQQPRRDEDYQSDSDSFNPALWEEQRQQRMTVAFDFEEKEEEEDNTGKVKVEINLKRYPTPYPEDLKNMVKSIQSVVGKGSHAFGPDKGPAHTSMELHGIDKYEHKWPTATVAPVGNTEVTAQAINREAKDFQTPMRVEPGQLHALEKEGGAEGSEDSRCGSPNDIRISDMRPMLVEAPSFKPKGITLGRHKKDSVDESDADKAQCLNTSGSSGPSSEYSPSQASSVSSNPPGPRPVPPTAPQEATPTAHWTSRFGPALPLLCQRETPPPRPLSDSFDRWNAPPHYDNTAFVGEDPPTVAPPPSGSRPPSASGPARRPLLRQERIMGLPLELEGGALLVPSADRLPPTPAPREGKSKFRKSQSIDEIDSAPTIYNIPLVDVRGDGDMHRPQPIPRSQSAPMLDDDALDSQPQPAPRGGGHHTPPPRLRAWPRGGGLRAEDRGGTCRASRCSLRGPGAGAGAGGGARSRPGLLRRADSLVSSAELAVFRRAVEAQQLQLAERGGRPVYRSVPEQQGAPPEPPPPSPALPPPGRPVRRGAGAQKPPLPAPRRGGVPHQEPAPAPAHVCPQLQHRGLRRPAGPARLRPPLHGRPAGEEAPRPQPEPLSGARGRDRPAPRPNLLSAHLRPDALTAHLRQEMLSSRMPADWRQQLLRHIEAKRLDRSAFLQHNTLNLGRLYSGRYATPHASGHVTLDLYSNAKGSLSEKDLEELSPMSQWGAYALSRRDVPPESLLRKAGILHSSQAMMSSVSAPSPQYEGGVSELSFQPYQPALPAPPPPSLARPQSARSLLQTKGQKSREGYQEQVCVRIEKSPGLGGLGFSISGGVTGQGNPFRPSDMGIFVTRVQPDGPATHLLQPGDKIMQANGHSFLNMEHTTAVCLLKSFHNPVDLVISREGRA